MEESASASKVRGDGRGQLPLAIAQEQLWFIEQMSPGEPTYNVPLTYRLRGALDVEALQRALTRVIARHDALRATIVTADGVAYQRIAPPGPAVPLAIDDLTAVDHSPAGRARRALEAEAIARTEAAKPFDLATGPLYRFRLVRVDDREHLLCITIHHIVTDGWSTAVFNRDLAAEFRAATGTGEVSAGGHPDPARTAGTETYADHIARQRRDLTAQRAEEHLNYWERQLGGLSALDLPADRARPSTQTFAGDMVDHGLPDGLVPELRALARRSGVSLFTLLTAALVVVLNRYTSQVDLPLGMTMTGRDTPESEEVVGLFANMVVLRADLRDDPPFGELLERLMDTTFDAFDHAATPFEQVVERLAPVRDPGRNPLFQVSVQMLGDANSGANLDLAGLTVEPVTVPTGRSRFDMAVTFVESSSEIRTTIEYATDLYDRWRVEALAGHVDAVLSEVVRDPSLRVSQLAVLGPAERARLVAMGAGERAEQVPDPVHVRIARTAAAHPDRTAVSFQGERLSYAELDRRADRMARHLRSRGVTRGEVVPVMVYRDLDTLVALLGVLKAGAAFTILDPDHPVSRLDHIIHDAGARLVITTSRLLDRLPEARDWTPLQLDADWPEIESAPVDGPLSHGAGRDDVAYVLYTSGSTGRPKGVQIEHRALNSFITAYQAIFDLTPDDRMLQFNALSFDMCQGETFTGLAVGATMVLVPPDVVGSPEQVSALMRAEQVSYICIPPAMMALMEPAPYPALRKIMVGGEAAPGELVSRWNLPGRRMINVYGPTEATVGCTSYECPREEMHSSPPIGGPLLDRQLYVVDGADNLVPVGVPGELLIGGDEGLARGYLNLPDLDAERFRPDPVRPGARVYRSGDLVRWRPDGMLEFLGRLDHQVKLRGLRIELGEIEVALSSHPQVAMAVTALRPDARGEPQLVGYAVPAGSQRPSVAELRQHVGGHLPGYMVPTTVMLLDALPTTTTGKIDRKALPTPPIAADHEPQVEPVATPTEAQVAAILAEVLSLPHVGADGNLFEMGGSSLQASRVVSRINREFGVNLKVRMLYGSATVRTIAAVVDEMVDAGDGGGKDGSAGDVR